MVRYALDKYFDNVISITNTKFYIDDASLTQRVTCEFVDLFDRYNKSENIECRFNINIENVEYGPFACFSIERSLIFTRDFIYSKVLELYNKNSNKTEIEEDVNDKPLYIIKDKFGNQLSAPNSDDSELWDRVASMEARGKTGLRVVAYTPNKQ